MAERAAQRGDELAERAEDYVAGFVKRQVDQMQKRFAGGIGGDAGCDQQPAPQYKARQQQAAAQKHGRVIAVGVAAEQRVRRRVYYDGYLRAWRCRRLRIGVVFIVFGKDDAAVRADCSRRRHLAIAFWAVFHQRAPFQ